RSSPASLRREGLEGLAKLARGGVTVIGVYGQASLDDSSEVVVDARHEAREGGRGATRDGLTDFIDGIAVMGRTTDAQIIEQHADGEDVGAARGHLATP